MSVLYTLIWLAVTLVFIGFFAGIEVAFVSANRLNVELKKKQGKSSGIILSRFMDHPAAFIGTCFVGFTICMVAYGLLFSELMRSTLWNPVHINNPWLKLAFDTLLSTLIVLIAGIFIPKAVWRARNDTLLVFFAPLFSLFHGIFNPITTALVAISQWMLKNIFNVRVKENTEPFSKVDLELFYQQTGEQDEDNPDLNKDLFENALSLPNIKTRQCLVPRTEIEAIEINSTVEEARQRFIETKLSKMVVYEDNIDTILGYMHQLDLFKKPKEIRTILLPIPAVPESMSATDLINKFSKERKSIAWVVDEFGGTAGIVTMEDVLEEIFGEIKDEYDTEELSEKQESETEFTLSGRLELDYLNEKYNFDFPAHESETLSGYIINEHKTIPKLKERIIIGHYEFDVLEVSDTRIETVKMKVLR
jgi:CBS domain containing-hemolysin-like protein